MATLADLRKQAKAMGIPASEVRGAESADELQSLMDSYNGAKPRKKAKAVVKKATAKRGRVVKKAKVEKPRRGRPLGSKNKPKQLQPVRKSTGSKPGRKPARKTGGNGYVKKGTRHELGTIDFDKTKGWNPRTGSAPDKIIKALKKARGNREKAFDALVGDIWFYMKKKKQNGQTRTKAESHEMLKYRIARTLWDFARQTKQHKVATGRAEYGSGNGTATKRKAPVKSSRPRGRPKGSTTKARAPQARRKAPVTPKRGRGRPKGSKNKPK
jgi:hypothetical protein